MHSKTARDRRPWNYRNQPEVVKSKNSKQSIKRDVFSKTRAFTKRSLSPRQAPQSILNNFTILPAPPPRHSFSVLNLCNLPLPPPPTPSQSLYRISPKRSHSAGNIRSKKASIEQIPNPIKEKRINMMNRVEQQIKEYSDRQKKIRQLKENKEEKERQIKEQVEH
ncbi:MAG: hypothetical protein EZS28_046313 [Streblomastix strix]|uniref:Uncharacterized protein n=1 Tax=Streblomastix strix TaxID=222440 RepID=A0A5J4TK26_9EUKA|nr:MAG: hypothetical protein EZS28_046313 [Streblomastix strix]